MSTEVQSIPVSINDEPSQVAVGTTLGSLLESRGLGAQRGVAAAVNGEVVTRSLWGTRVLLAGEKILLIRATQGG